MLEHHAVTATIAAYLRATRGDRSDQLRFPTSELLQFFDDVVDSFRISGLPLPHVRLCIVDSARVDIETMLTGVGGYVVFDQSIYDVFRLLTTAFFREVNAHAGWPVPLTKGTPSWLHAIFANRYLGEGLRSEALVHAMQAWATRRSKPEDAVDVHKLNGWVTVQSAFALAHEIGHCQLTLESNEIIARSMMGSFEEQLRPFVQYMDEVHSDPEQREAASQADEQLAKERLAWEQQVRQRHEELLKLRSEAAEQIQLLNPAFPFPDLPGDVSELAERSSEETLDWILQDVGGIGEEVLADFMALSFTARILGDRVLPFDECLGACVIALRALALVRVVEVVCHGYASAPLPESELVELLDQTMTRRWFVGLSAQILSQNQHLRELDEESAIDDIAASVNERDSSFARYLTHFGHVWDTRFLEAVLAMSPGSTQASRDRVAAEPQFKAWTQSPVLPRIIAHHTEVGPKPTDEDMDAALQDPPSPAS